MLDSAASIYRAVLLILFGHFLAGPAVRSVGLPLVTGHLFTGIIGGPYALGLLTSEDFAFVMPFSGACLGCIAVAAGSELNLSQLSSQRQVIVATLAGQLPAIFLCSGFVAYLLWAQVAPLTEAPTTVKLSAAALVATILMSRSPASALAVIRDVRATGPFCRVVLSVSVIADALLMLVFTAAFQVALSISRTTPSTETWANAYDAPAIAAATGKDATTALRENRYHTVRADGSVFIDRRGAQEVRTKAHNPSSAPTSLESVSSSGPRTPPMKDAYRSHVHVAQPSEQAAATVAHGVMRSNAAGVGQGVGGASGAAGGGGSGGAARSAAVADHDDSGAGGGGMGGVAVADVAARGRMGRVTDAHGGGVVHKDAVRDSLLLPSVRGTPGGVGGAAGAHGGGVGGGVSGVHGVGVGGAGVLGAGQLPGLGGGGVSLKRGSMEAVPSPGTDALAPWAPHHGDGSLHPLHAAAHAHGSESLFRTLSIAAAAIAASVAIGWGCAKLFAWGCDVLPPLITRLQGSHTTHSPSPTSSHPPPSPTGGSYSDRDCPPSPAMHSPISQAAHARSRALLWCLPMLLFTICYVVFSAELFVEAAVGIPYEPMLSCLAMGFFIVNYTNSGSRLESVLATFLNGSAVCFFVLAGTTINALDLVGQSAVVCGLWASRLAGLYVGTSAGSAVCGLEGDSDVVRRYRWAAFATQAGVALGLARRVGGSVLPYGRAIGPIVSAVVVLNEVFGPIMLKVALQKVGEAGAADEVEAEEKELRKGRDNVDGASRASRSFDEC